MYRGWIERAAVGLILLACGPSWGQDAPPTRTPPGQTEKGPADKGSAEKEKPSQLEEMLAQVLRTNPDIRVAEAKLAEAEAQLTRARLQAIQQAVAQYQELAALRAEQQTLLDEMKFIERMVQKGFRPEGDLKAAEQKLMAAKSALAAAEAQVAYLRGTAGPEGGDKAEANAQVSAALRYLALRQVQAAGDSSVSASRALGEYYSNLAALGYRARLQGPVSEKLREALDKPVDLGGKEVTLDALPGLLQKHLPEGVYVKVVPGKEFPDKVSLDLKGLPLGAALQWLEDSLPGGRIVVRGYGLLITEEGRAPSGAPALSEFWKGPAPEKAPTTPSPRSDLNPPPKNVEGTVQAVEEGTGLVEVSVGADAGLSEGHTLEVYRLKPPRYLGTIRILKVEPKKAVGRPEGRLSGKIEPGDRVASRILGN